MDEQKQVGGWEDYINNFLKASEVKDINEKFPCVAIEDVEFDGKQSLRLHLDNGEEKYLFDLNKTNASFIKNEGIKNPKDIVGKSLSFKKVNVTNPTTKKEVESLRIVSVE